MHQVRKVMVNMGSQYISNFSMNMNVDIGWGLRVCVFKKH